MSGEALQLVPFATRVRRYVGQPDERELPSPELVELLRGAVRRVQRSIGTEAGDSLLAEIPTVAGQQTYTVPTDRRVLEVFWGPSFGDAQPLSGAPSNPFPEIPMRPGSTIVGSYWRSDQVIDEIRADQIARQWRAEVMDGRIWLDPIPDEDGLKIMYNYVPIGGAVRELTEEHSRALMFAAAADVQRFLANQRRGRLTPITREGLQSSNSVEDLERSADKNDDRFREAVAELKNGTG